MSKVIETEDIAVEPIVRQVSNMVKDGNNSGPPMLFRHASMQKIRHCCQNLNLFPYLLYTFDNSKSHPLSRKIHLCLGHFLQILIARLFVLYKSFRQSVFLSVPEKTPGVTYKTEPCKPQRLHIWRTQQKRKRENRLFLIMAVYFAPLLLAFQLIGLFGLLVIGKHTPGFIFLFSTLLCLGYILLKIFFHEKYENKSKKLKTQ